MNNESTPKLHIIQLNKQPLFPMEDLNTDNAEVLKYVLANEPGVDVYSRQLEKSQHYLYRVANRALRMLGVQSTYSPGELRAFSHGFAGFEVISDLVHEPRAYAVAPAAGRVAEFLVNSANVTDSYIDDDEITETIGEGSYRMLLTPRMEDALKGIPSLPIDGQIGHDATEPEKLFTTRHAILPQKYPNTYDVIVSMGEARNETIAQLQLRVAGAGLARTLQTND